MERATALLFVVDASAPFSQPELDFLIEASKRVNFVMFALTKTDAYPGWRTILADDQAQLQAHAPRFGARPGSRCRPGSPSWPMTMPRRGRSRADPPESRIAELCSTR